MRKILIVIFAAIFAVNCAGCASIQKKFTRKKKVEKKVPRIFQEKKYEKNPTPELYAKHYAYWMNWQSEIIATIGQNHKKDLRSINEIIGNLRDMQNILVKAKADEFEPHIKKLERIQDSIAREDLSPANRDSILMTLEREDRFIKREFSTKKIVPFIKRDFDDDGTGKKEEPKPQN